MATVSDEVIDIAHLAQLIGIASDLVIRESPGIPVPRRREVIGQHLVGEHCMNCIGPVFVIFQVWFSCLTPHQVGERRHRQPASDRHFPPAGNLIKTFRGSRQIPIPESIDVHGLCPRSRFLMRYALGKFLPPVDRHRKLRLVLLARLYDFGNRIGIRLEPGFFRPNLADSHEHAIHRLFGNFFDHDLIGRQLFTKVALTVSLATGLLTYPFKSRHFVVDLFNAFSDPLGQTFLFQPFPRVFVGLF